MGEDAKTDPQPPKPSEPYREAPLPAPPVTERELPWLGTRTFWLVALAVFVATFAGFFIAQHRLLRPDAIVPVVSLTGPSQATKGETVRYAVLVRDRFGAPLANVPVRLGFQSTKLVELGRATTDEGGEASVAIHFPDDFAEQRSLVAIAEAGVADGSDDLVVSPKSPGQGSIFVSTDKPLYQPGQVVHLRALAMAGDRPVADAPSVIEIRTPDGIKVFRAEKPTSAFGVVSADFELADQVKLGAYAISVTTTITPAAKGDAGVDHPAVTVRAERSIEVKRYSLPKLKLALEDVSTFAPDGPLKGVARATWIFGEPVTKGNVRVELLRNGTNERSVVGTTDKDGTFRFELPPRPGKANLQSRGTFALVARLWLDGGLSADARQTVTSLGGDPKIEVFPESGVLARDVEQLAYVVVTEAATKAGLTVRALPDGEPAKTSERGIAIVKVKPGASTSVAFAAYADDGGEAKVDVQTASALVVRPDRAAYSAGDAARVTVLGASAGDRIAVRMTKGNEPIAIASCVVAAADRGCEASLVVPPSVSGLVWLHALSLPKDRGEVRSGKRLIVAGSGARDLDVKIASDKKVFAPRENGAIDVAVSAAGAPVTAQLGIAVADEAVFALADVRPDLEKIFFTVDRDLAASRGDYRPYRRYGYGTSDSQHALPPGYEAAAAYDGATDAELRATILAALTTMPEAGAAEGSTSEALASSARYAVEDAKRRLSAWCILTVAAFALLAFAGFGAYGVVRFRRPLSLATPATSDEDARALRLETRALFADYLLGVFAPPLLAVTAFAAGALFDEGGSSNAARAVYGAWLILTGLCVVQLVRSALRVRRAAAARDATLFKRALFFLPIAIFLGQLTVLLVLTDEGRRLRMVLPGDEKRVALLVPFAILAGAQITSGLLSVVRQTQLRAVTTRGRVWLLASRMTFSGFPVTLFSIGLVFYGLHKEKHVDGSDFAEQRMEPPSSPDNKEGGTGTRAKGEEGSMGNPNAHASGAAAPSGGGGAVAKPPVHVRDFFPETLLWAPDVVTDDRGHARIEVPFADSITTWRFGVNAVSKAGQLGSATAALVVKQDFFVDTLLPPTLTQGDAITVPVTVFSYTDGAQDVALALEGDGVSTIGPSQIALHLAKGEARGVRFTIKADKAGERVVRLRAQSASRADAMEKKILVVPNGQRFERAINGRASGTSKATVEFPGNAIDGGNDLYVKVYGGPLSQLAEGLDGVFQMPHGCFEQTSSTTYPSVLALRFLERSKATSPEVEKKARAYIAQGYQRLISFEVPGGGFSLFGKEPASTALTAYGLLEFSEMARVATVDERLVERTRQWLLKKRTSTGGWAKATYDDKDEPKDDVLVTAYAAWAIAASSDAPDKDTNVASVLDVVAKQSGPESEDPYALALRANALLAGGRKDDARAILDRLAQAAIKNDEGVHFASKAAGVMHSYGASMEVEVTGLASHALAVAGMEAELRSGALDWLAARKGARGTWSTTQATIAAMRAMLDDARPVTNAPQEVEVVVDGEKVETYTLEPKARDVHRLVGAKKLATTGKHFVEVRASGDGDVSFQVVATHWLPWQKRTGAGLSLEVSYGPTSVDTGSTLGCQVKLGWRGKEPARMPMVEIGVPPAFEVDGDELDALVKKSAVARYTIERGKVTLYLTALAEEKPMAVDLRMRALRPAHVVVPGSAAYLYYEPEVRTETAPLRVQSM